MRMLGAALLATSLVLAVAPPAGADPPGEMGSFVDVFEDVDPCTDRAGRSRTCTLRGAAIERRTAIDPSRSCRASVAEAREQPKEEL